MIARTVALLLALVAVASAQDDKAKAEYEKKIAAARKKAAVEYATLGKWAAEKKAHQLACPCWERAIVYDPDEPTARKNLGFKKEGNSWVEIPRYDILRAYMGPNDKKEAIEADFETRKPKAEKKLADEFANVGKFAKDKGMAAEAESCYREAIIFDPDHEASRKALGHVKENGVWVSPADKEAQKANAAKVAGAGEGEEWNEETDVEKALGLKLSKRKSERFKVWAFYGGDPLKKTIKLAEAAQTEFYAIFELPADTVLAPPPIELIILETQDHHGVFIDALSGCAEGDKKWMKSLGGYYSWNPPRGECWAGPWGPDYGIDFAIHQTTHILWYYYAGEIVDRAWIFEGLAYYMSARLNDTASTFCIAQQSGAMGGKSIGTPPGWKALIKAGLKDGTDPDMRATLNAGTNSLNSLMCVKAWSLLDWFFTARKKDFMRFLGMMKSGTPQDQALLDAFGGSYDELQSDWASWVKANY